MKNLSRDRQGALKRNDLRPLPDGRGSNLHKLGTTDLGAQELACPDAIIIATAVATHAL